MSQQAWRQSQEAHDKLLTHQSTDDVIDDFYLYAYKGRETCEYLYDVHNKAYRWNKKCYFWGCLCPSLLAAAFTTIASAVPAHVMAGVAADEDKYKASGMVKGVVTALSGSITGLLAAVAAFWDWHKHAEQHLAAAMSFQKVYNECDRLISEARIADNNAMSEKVSRERFEELEALQNRIKEINTSAPPLTLDDKRDDMYFERQAQFVIKKHQEEMSEDEFRSFRTSRPTDPDEDPDEVGLGKTRFQKITSICGFRSRSSQVHAIKHEPTEISDAHGKERMKFQNIVRRSQDGSRKAKQRYKWAAEAIDSAMQEKHDLEDKKARFKHQEQDLQMQIRAAEARAAAFTEQESAVENLKRQLMAQQSEMDASQKHLNEKEADLFRLKKEISRLNNDIEAREGDDAKFEDLLDQRAKLEKEKQAAMQKAESQRSMFDEQETKLRQELEQAQANIRIQAEKAEEERKEKENERKAKSEELEERRKAELEAQEWHQKYDKLQKDAEEQRRYHILMEYEKLVAEHEKCRLEMEAIRIKRPAVPIDSTYYQGASSALLSAEGNQKDFELKHKDVAEWLRQKQAREKDRPLHLPTRTARPRRSNPPLYGS